MKKTIIYCDRCKKEIKKGEDWLLSKIDGTGFDLCDSCVSDMEIPVEF